MSCQESSNTMVCVHIYLKKRVHDKKTQKNWPEPLVLTLPPFHRCQSGLQRQCQSHRRWCYSIIGSLEIMSLWLPRRYWIRAWEPVWRRAVQQYSSRVQSTEYRRGGTAAACWSERQRLQRLEITTRLWSNALVNSDSMQIKGGDMKYLRVIQKFTFDTLWPDPWPMLPQFQWRIYNLFL